MIEKILKSLNKVYTGLHEFFRIDPEQAALREIAYQYYWMYQK